MFDFSDSDLQYIRRTLSDRPRVLRSEGGLEIRGTSQKPFYVSGKQSWVDFLENGLSHDRTADPRNKHLHNASFTLSSIDFFLLLLLESCDERGNSCLAPGILNGIQQSVAVSCQSVLEGIGQYWFRKKGLSPVKGFKNWECGILDLIECSLPLDKKKSPLEVLNKARNKIHQDDLTKRDEDYFARLESEDICIPVKALQKTIVAIWKKHPPQQDGKPRNLVQKSPLTARDLDEQLRKHIGARRSDHWNHQVSKYFQPLPDNATATG